MLTDAEKRELDALQAKAELSDEEKARLEVLKAKAKEDPPGGNDEKVFSEAYVKGLRTESAKYRTKAREAEEKLARFDGIDPAEHLKLLELKKQQETQKLEEEGQWEKLKAQLVESHTKEQEKFEAERVAFNNQIKGLEAELSNTILGHEIAVAAGTAQAINPKLVEITLKSMNMATVEQGEDGTRVIKVLNDDGETARIDPQTGDPMTVLQLLEDMKQSKEYAHLFAGGKPGAGSNTNFFRDGQIENPWKTETRNLTKQAEILKADPALAKRLRAEAGK